MSLAPTAALNALRAPLLPGAGAGSATHALWCVLHFVAAAIQLNDPDPVLWVMAYGSVAVFHAMSALLRPAALPPQALFLALPALLCALSLYALRGATPQQLLYPLRLEPAREALGMAVCLLSISLPTNAYILAAFGAAMGAWLAAGLGCI